RPRQTSRRAGRRGRRHDAVAGPAPPGRDPGGRTPGPGARRAPRPFGPQGGRHQGRLLHHGPHAGAAMSAVLDLARVAPGFTDPVRQSQAVFRKVMDAVARPGTIADLAFAPDAPDGLARAAGAVALALF